MSWSWTLYRYLAEQFLARRRRSSTRAFLLLAFSIDIVDLINRTAGHGVSTVVVVGMALLQLPDLGQKMLPFAVLLGGVFAFARLSRSQELVAIRAAGMSAWDFLAPPLAVAACARHLRRDDLHADLGAHARRSSPRWRRSTSRARRRSSPFRATDCGCARATRRSNR